MCICMLTSHPVMAHARGTLSWDCPPDYIFITLSCTQYLHSHPTTLLYFFKGANIINFRFHLRFLFYQTWLDLLPSRRRTRTEKFNFLEETRPSPPHLKWQLAVSVAHYIRTNKAKESRAGFSCHNPVWSLKESLKTNEFWIHVSSIASSLWSLPGRVKKKSPTVHPLSLKIYSASALFLAGSLESVKAGTGN